MAAYKTKFDLSIKDVELIESSIRCQISLLAQTEASPQSSEAAANHYKIIELMTVLGSLHNQKIWYGQTRHTGVPLG